MSVFTINKASEFKLAPLSIVEDKQLIRNTNLINGGIASVSIICNLNEAKDYIGENWKVYVKNRDRVIPKNKSYGEFPELKDNIIPLFGVKLLNDNINNEIFEYISFNHITKDRCILSILFPSNYKENNDIEDIEDLLKNGKKEKFCPYFYNIRKYNFD